MTHIRVFNLDSKTKEVHTFSSQLIGYFKFQHDEWVYLSKPDIFCSKVLMKDILDAFDSCYDIEGTK